MEPDKSVEPIMASRALQFDAAAEVPDEYDLLCEGCGYSLVGISSDICPECGKAFEPHQLLIARVPWLHRRKIGRIKAYFATLRFVLRRPKQFAEELCRPVRISIADARAFRRTTINLVLLAYLLCVTEIGIPVVAKFIREARQGPAPVYLPLVWYLAAAAVIAITVLFGLSAMFYMMTDLPVFIWKGHPSLRASELSPIQCYAAAGLAPLMVAPVLTLLIIFIDGPANGTLPPMLLLCGGLLLATFLFRMLTTPLRLMSGSRMDRRRVKLMAFYLPMHWLLMALVCALSTVIAIGLESWIIHQLDPTLRLEPPAPNPFSNIVVRHISGPVTNPWGRASMRSTATTLPTNVFNPPTESH